MSNYIMYSFGQSNIAPLESFDFIIRMRKKKAKQFNSIFAHHFVFVSVIILWYMHYILDCP